MTRSFNLHLFITQGSIKTSGTLLQYSTSSFCLERFFSAPSKVLNYELEQAIAIHHIAFFCPLQWRLRGRYKQVWQFLYLTIQPLKGSIVPAALFTSCFLLGSKSYTLANQQSLDNQKRTHQTNQHRINVSNLANKQQRTNGRVNLSHATDRSSYHAPFFSKVSYLSTFLSFSEAERSLMYSQAVTNAKTFLSAIAFCTIAPLQWA